MQREHGLRLGPIVGHTDDRSSCVWIRVDGSPAGWSLAVDGRSSVPFVETPGAPAEFGTAIARIGDLDPDTYYAYSVHRDGEIVATGRFRTMPVDGEYAGVTFVTLSCDDDREPNAWELLAQFIAKEEPRFILMIGDQVYMDEGEQDLWRTHRDAAPSERRRAMAEKYQKVWDREPIARILANTPIYMTWDDHDIRDGWGSFAGDSRFLAEEHPETRAVHDVYDAFYQDAASAFEHFQASRNPDAALKDSSARPFYLRCGRLLVVVPDGRSDRDFARPELPVLGAQQWEFVDRVVESEVDESVDVIAVATAVPIVDVDPEGPLHRLFRDRTDDIDRLLEGDLERVDELLYRGDNPLTALVSTIAGMTVDRDFKIAKSLGFRITDLDDVRDKWSYETNRPEQARMLTTFAEAACAGREGADPRSIIFLGGDIHVGAVFRIDVASPPVSMECVVTSGIGKNAPIPEVVGVLVDQDFDVTAGIHAHLNFVVNQVNFAVTRVTYDGTQARVDHEILCEGQEQPSPDKN